MKNKKGFTLIELLAVIVVLAIIALIATPIVMNTIKNAKKGAAERTADNYIKQVETAVAEAKLGNKSVPNGTYDIDGNGNLTGAGLPDGKLEINMSGNKPTSGTIKISNGGVSKEGTTMTVGDYDVKYNQEKNRYEASEKGNTPQVEVLCTAKTTATTGNVPSGNYAYGDEYTCELGDNDEKTFFVLETNGDNVSLIMDRNIALNGKGRTSDEVAWVTYKDYLAAGGTESDWGDYGNNNLGPITVNKILKERTSAWTKLDEDQITLPSGQQIATASGKTFDASSISESSELPTWLYGNLSIGVPYGYWTSTPSYSSNAWIVYYGGNMDHNSYLGRGVVNGSGNPNGVRPVITVSKSNLS